MDSNQIANTCTLAICAATLIGLYAVGAGHASLFALSFLLLIKS